MVPTNYYLVLSAMLFGLGVLAFIFRRNIITYFHVHRIDAERREPGVRGFQPGDGNKWTGKYLFCS